MATMASTPTEIKFELLARVPGSTSPGEAMPIGVLTVPVTFEVGASADGYIDVTPRVGELATADGEFVLVRRADVEHVALSMADCFSDAEASVLNRLRAVLGFGPVEKVGRGAGRRWIAEES